LPQEEKRELGASEVEEVLMTNYYVEALHDEQEKMSVSSADMTCGRPSSCQGLKRDNKLGLTMG